ncbi:HAMP domain-containing protein [Sporosarcina sp. ANT_H38]|uniref:cache domain-containing sensor histidine kinase n=1 Tax=Sporosarcina sp. ANT_H38 TaxID=2597358 RepID=UPI0011F3833A|nr:histidine kinase [Sporosarcina sp. ANT_H38]KAA0966193.1 HAMP domain-containing protein [Sporosarcina sp. ANT_H38]
MNQLKSFLQLFRFKHVNHQIFVLMILTITIPLLILSVMIYIFSIQSAKNEYQNSSNLILNNLSFNFDQYLQSIEMGALTAQMDSKLQNALENWGVNDSERDNVQSLEYENAIEHFISTIEITIENVDSVQIYIGDRVFYSTLKKSVYDVSNLTNEEWYKQTIAQKGKIVLFGTHQPFNRVNPNESVISIARVINKSGSRQPLGVLLIDIRLDSLRNILDLSENHNRNFVILDPIGTVIYASDLDQIDSAMAFKPAIQPLLTDSNEEFGNFYAPVDGVYSFFNFVTSPYSGWTVIQYIEEQEMTKHADMLRKVILGLAFFSIGMAMLFMVILYIRVTEPIIYLSRQVKMIGRGKFDVNLTSKRQDEFGGLYQGISKMVTDIQDYIERSSVLKAQQKLAHYRALKSQINPHFLANALESIQMKAVLNKQRDIAEMIGVLGQLFRINIQSGKETITLEEEMTHIRLYIQVQQMRFGDKIQYIENLAPTSESMRLLHFSLQPLVENGIVHGLERKYGAGVLEVSSTFSGKDMLILVKDNGVGIDEEQLRHLQDRLAQVSNTLTEEHIGLKNVHDQIRYYYGDQYGIEIDSLLGVGTTVTIRIPARP